MPTLDRLAGTWNHLVDNSVYPNVFLRWEWITAWWKRFGTNRRLYVLEVGCGDRLVGVVPWYYERTSVPPAIFGRRLRFLGAGGPTSPEYLGPIIHRDHLEAVVQAVQSHLAEQGGWASIEFADVPPDDAGTNLLITELRKLYPALRWPGEVCPYLQLPESYEALLARLSSHGRQRKKRQLRRAMEECDARLHLAQLDGDLGILFETMSRLSALSRGRVGQNSPFADPGYRGFHEEVVAHLLPKGIARIYMLDFHGAPVAFMYGFACNGKYYAFQTGFDGSCERFSPGDVLYQMIFQDLIEQQSGEFDYLRGDESYKSFFANAERRTSSTVVFRRRGLAYWSAFGRLRLLKPARLWLKSRLRPLLRPDRRPTRQGETGV